ncbi:MAG: PaaI family thioesterase [Roseiarcus sp.]
MTARTSRVHFTLEEMNAYLREIFPQAEFGETFVVEEVQPMQARLRLKFDEKHLRPGGTISGPSMFTLADVALFVAVLGMIGRVRLAVTTNLNINFLKKPPPADLVGEARLMKLGSRLAVGEVSIRSAAETDLVAHAVGTYSIPARGD